MKKHVGLSLVILAAVGVVAAVRLPADPPKPSGDVTAFGAVGDGQADDTAAIQKAIDAGGEVRFPRGTYRLTKSVTIDLDKTGFTSLSGGGVARVVMAGPGPAFKFVGTHQGTAAPPSVKDNVWKNQRAPMIDGLEIVGSHEEACGVEADGTMKLTITRLLVRDALHAIRLAGRNRNVIISDCHLYHNRGVGVYYDDVDLHQSNITGCHISYNDQGGVVCRKGNVRNVHISGCDIESNMGAKAKPTANVLIDCADSKYGTAEVAITGCTLQHNKTGEGSANIRILGKSEAHREGHVTITGNVFSDVKVNVHLKDCRGVTLTGNTFWMGYEHNLLVEDCSHVVVGPNNFERNPRYDYGDALTTRNGLVFRGCDDCTLTGLHVAHVWKSPAGLVMEKCRRCNVTNCLVLDCDGPGILLDDVTDCRFSDCLVRDDREGGEKPPSLVLKAGKRNLIVDNVLGNGHQVAEGAARLAGNESDR